MVRFFAAPQLARRSVPYRLPSLFWINKEVGVCREVVSLEMSAYSREELAFIFGAVCDRGLVLIICTDFFFFFKTCERIIYLYGK